VPLLRVIQTAASCDVVASSASVVAADSIESLVLSTPSSTGTTSAASVDGVTISAATVASVEASVPAISSNL